jgi:o-succinylbenzoate synthase
LKASFEKYLLEFKRPSGTSRGVLKKKSTYFITIDKGKNKAIGEAALFRGLSADDVPEYETKLQEVCDHIEKYQDNFHEELRDFPSIVFGLEQAFLKLKNASGYCFENSFTEGSKGIPMNGLIWMGDQNFMHDQIEAKLADGYSCLKLKIGAIDFEKEMDLLSELRKRFTTDKLEIRVDANGAFLPHEALAKLARLAALDLHSIEQPIRAGQVSEMAELCKETSLAIALDEELIGVQSIVSKRNLLARISPQYIILKPALVGGFLACDGWIKLAEEMNIGWWITSALESNLGLEAIAEYTASKNTNMYQGLGTGQLFTNNLTSKLEIRDAKLWMSQS